MLYKPTELMYMSDMFQLEVEAKIIDIVQWPDDRVALIIDRTIFYPQGGGQPYDIGSIDSATAHFNVEEVRFKDGIVYHIGMIEKGSLHKGDDAILRVDQERRMYNSRNHTSGHVVDIAMSNIGMNLTPGRGYHFPQGAYVEYLGSLA